MQQVKTRKTKQEKFKEKMQKQAVINKMRNDTFYANKKLREEHANKKRQELHNEINLARKEGWTIGFVPGPVVKANHQAPTLLVVNVNEQGEINEIKKEDAKEEISTEKTNT